MLSNFTHKFPETSKQIIQINNKTFNALRYPFELYCVFTWTTYKIIVGSLLFYILKIKGEGEEILMVENNV